ncbi:DUF6249 domain-containing protein [Kangiella sp.]|uniref:DUF6249 domain-containing protein n=1 Tax=Kangiella sp. TaxID=1920245 RepID=UPI0019A86F96|nr:DUF6249 domain-containing protein [Kangiella sp.]MBD3652709.1 hypothetical protein [Kangiella sp.]
MSDLWIPITGMLCITAGVIVYLMVTVRYKKQFQLILKQHLENGGTLSPDLLEQLGAVPTSSRSDLRKALILLALGLGCLAAGWFAGVFNLGAVFGVFPLFLGVAFFVSAFLSNNE